MHGGNGNIRSTHRLHCWRRLRRQDGVTALRKSKGVRCGAQPAGSDAMPVLTIGERSFGGARGMMARRTCMGWKAAGRAVGRAFCIGEQNACNRNREQESDKPRHL